MNNELSVNCHTNIPTVVVLVNDHNHIAEAIFGSKIVAFIAICLSLFGKKDAQSGALVFVAGMYHFYLRAEKIEEQYNE